MHPPVTKQRQPAGWRERIASLSNLGPLLKIVWETGPSLILSTAVMRFAKALIPVGMLWISKLIIDGVVALISPAKLAPAHASPIWTLVALEFALAISSDLLGRGVALYDSLLSDRFANRISVKLMQHAAKLDLASFEDPVFYDKLERARRQTTGRIALVSGVSGICQDLVTLVSLSGALILFSPCLFLLLPAAVLPSFLGETHFANLEYSMLYSWTPQRRELDYVRLLGASLQSAKEVKIFGLGEYLAERYRRLSDRFYDENKTLAFRRASVGALLNSLGTGGYYAAYVFILARTMAGAITVGSLTFLAGSFARSRSLIENILSGFGSISEQALFLSDLFEFFEMQPAIRSSPHSLPAPRPIRHGFEFQGVGFAYPGSSRQIVQNITFHLNPTEKMALIGENGAGKTTLVKLLARLYDPTEGRILLDGVDLREYSVEDLRKEIGVIFQDYMRYEVLVKENIGFGKIENLDLDPTIREAAEKSLAAGVIARLPDGYDQMIGRRFEGGVDLSGGEWQKMALARAYMRAAQLLILDEPTATLDARAEYEVFLRFADLTKERMSVLISHRFSTVRMANRILVLDGGQIREQGSHRQLVALGGRYAELFELQAAGYR
jgi:ATP-binding cassette subfamily B protein